MTAPVVIFDIETAPVRADDPARLARAAAMRADMEAKIAALLAEPVRADGRTTPGTQKHADSIAERTAARDATVAALRDGLDVTLEATRRHTALDPYEGGRVVCVAWVALDDDGNIIDECSTSSDDERDLLSDVGHMLGSYGSARFVAHNAYAFDVPFLRVRSASYGLTRTASLFGPWRRFPDPSRVADTVDALPRMRGAPVLMSLGALADFLRVERAPDTITGADVPRLWESGDPDARRLVVDHCVADVLTLARVWSVLSGVL